MRSNHKPLLLLDLHALRAGVGDGEVELHLALIAIADRRQIDAELGDEGRREGRALVPNGDARGRRFGGAGARAAGEGDEAASEQGGDDAGLHFELAGCWARWGANERESNRRKLTNRSNPSYQQQDE